MGEDAAPLLERGKAGKVSEWEREKRKRTGKKMKKGGLTFETEKKSWSSSGPGGGGRNVCGGNGKKGRKRDLLKGNWDCFLEKIPRRGGEGSQS